MAKKGKVVLAIGSEENWYAQFKNAKLLDGTPVIIEQTRWKYLHAEAGSADNEKLICELTANADPFEGTSQANDRTVRPDFILFRNFPTELHGLNYRPLVMSLCFSGVKGVNTPTSVLRSMDRPIVHAEMIRISERVGKDKFPVIPMKFHPNTYNGTKRRLVNIEFPTVIKVGTAHAGFGKTVVKNKNEYFDIESILAMNTEYFTEEPFTQHDYEFRVQVIGPHVRCFRRNSSSSWKNNWGNVRFDDHPWNSKYELWVDQVRQIFGGMDMFALDVLHRKKKSNDTTTSSSSSNTTNNNTSNNNDDGEDFIIEINDFAMGLDFDFEVEDLKHIRELVLQRMNEEFCGAQPQNYVGKFTHSTYKRGDLKGKEYLQ